MFRAFLLILAIASSFTLTAQEVNGVDFNVDGDNVNVSYNLSAPANSITLFLDKGDGQWRQLEKVTGDVGDNITPGHKNIVWDLFSEYPDGIFADVCFMVVPNYTTPALDDVDYTKCNHRFSKSNGVIWGTKAYFSDKINYSKKYAGDLRKGTAATATDNISFSSLVMEYDFITREWRKLNINKSFSARVPRKTHNGLFPEPHIPNYRLYIDKTGDLRFEGELVAPKL